MDAEVVQAVADNMPKINRYLVEGYAKESMDDSVKFVDMTYRDAVRWGGNVIEYCGYRTLSPEDRAEKELEFVLKRKSRLSMAISERVLVEFKFRYQGKEYFTYIYMLYVSDGMLIVKDKRYAIHLGISECVFARVHNKSKDGIIVRPIRARLEFNRKSKARFASVSSGEILSEFVITTVLHHKEVGKRACDPTVMLYLVCKFGFREVVRTMAGLTDDDIGFREYPDMTKADEYEYFVATKETRDPKVHLYVRKELLDNSHLVRKIVVNLLYTLTHFSFQTVDDVYDPKARVWRIIMGIIIYKPSLHAKALADADTHIQSVDTFIDPLTRERFHYFGVNVDDIYQLLYYIFREIDRIMVNSSSNDLYSKRIDIIDGIFIASYATAIYRRFYKTNQRPKLQDREVMNMLKINPMVIEDAFSSRKNWGQSMHNISPAPQIYGDNILLSCSIFKLRPSGKQSERAHPSFAVVESIMAFSGNTVGVNGLINPYLDISRKTATSPGGAIIKPKRAAELEVLKQYLPAS